MALPPRAAFDGTRAIMWPGGVLTARGPVSHKSVLPIVRQALEIQLINALRAECTKVGAPFNVIRPHARWEEKFTGEELVITLTTKHAMIMASPDIAHSREIARWVGGPRDGQEVPALNGEIVWDGPLGVVVRDKQVLWRDVGDGARAAWAEMSSEEREEFRREIEADAGVTSSHDVEAPAPAHLPDQLAEPMAEGITSERVARVFGVPAPVIVAAEPPRFPRDGDIWIDTDF